MSTTATSTNAYKVNFVSIRVIPILRFVSRRPGKAQADRELESDHGRDDARFPNLDPLHAMLRKCRANASRPFQWVAFAPAHRSSRAAATHPFCMRLENWVSRLVEMRMDAPTFAPGRREGVPSCMARRLRSAGIIHAMNRALLRQGRDRIPEHDFAAIACGQRVTGICAP